MSSTPRSMAYGIVDGVRLSAIMLVVVMSRAIMSVMRVSLLLLVIVMIVMIVVVVVIVIVIVVVVVVVVVIVIVIVVVVVVVVVVLICWVVVLLLLIITGMSLGRLVRLLDEDLGGGWYDGVDEVSVGGETVRHAIQLPLVVG